MELIIKDEEIDTEALEELLNRRKTAGSQLDQAESQVKDIDEKIREAAKFKTRGYNINAMMKPKLLKTSHLTYQLTLPRLESTLLKCLRNL